SSLLRTVLQVHEAGFALGVHHLDLFAFGMELDPDAAGHPRPRAILIAAPHATAFGQAFEPPPADLQRHPPSYPRLGFRGLPLAVSAGAVARPQADAIGLALLCLETLLDRPLPPA